MKNCLRITAVFFGAIGLGVPALAAPAPAGSNLLATPTNVQLDLDAGSTATGTAAIVDDGTAQLDFKTSVAPYNVSGEDYNQSFFLKPQQTDVSKWITLKQTNYHLEPHQRVDMAYKVAIPAGVAPGGYYAVLLAETKPQAIGGTGVATTKRVGIIFYLRVNGAVDEQGNVESFKSDWWQTAPPLVADLRLGNHGNVHYLGDIKMVITDLFGKKKAEIDSTHQVLPQTIRHLQLRWEQAPTFGLFKVGGTVNIFGRQEDLPNHYVLMMAQGPFFAMLVAILVFVALVVWSFKRRRKTRKRSNKRSR